MAEIQSRYVEEPVRFPGFLYAFSNYYGTAPARAFVQMRQNRRGHRTETHLND